jgi:Lrp/AsnC family leucine-responsive transcriptional regulator
MHNTSISAFSQLDKIDRIILAQLQINGRISNAALSRKVNLSPTPCLDRVRKLEKKGFIQGYMAILDPTLLDSQLLVFVESNLKRTAGDAFQVFRQQIMDIPEVLDCHLVSGNFDYLIKARVRDMQEYRSLLGEKILPIPGVEGSRTYVVMEEVKESLRLRIPN